MMLLVMTDPPSAFSGLPSAAGCAAAPGHQPYGPQVVPRELIARDQHIAAAMHGLHPDVRVVDDVVGNDHMVAVNVDALGSVLDVVAEDACEVAGLRCSDDDGAALAPVVGVVRLPRLLAQERALLRVLFTKSPSL